MKKIWTRFIAQRCVGVTSVIPKTDCRMSSLSRHVKVYFHVFRFFIPSDQSVMSSVKSVKETSIQDEEKTKQAINTEPVMS